MICLEGGHIQSESTTASGEHGAGLHGRGFWALPPGESLCTACHGSAVLLGVSYGYSC